MCSRTRVPKPPRRLLPAFLAGGVDLPLGEESFVPTGPRCPPTHRHCWWRFLRACPRSQRPITHLQAPNQSAVKSTVHSNRHGCPVEAKRVAAIASHRMLDLECNLMRVGEIVASRALSLQPQAVWLCYKFVQLLQGSSTVTPTVHACRHLRGSS